MKHTEQEELYLHLKRNYYDGNTLATDAEFDTLEAELKSKGSNVINMVGSKVAGATVAHPSPMKSLQKTNVEASSENYEKELIRKWITKASKDLGDVGDILECTLKYDGNACNFVFKDNKLNKILSRGDGEKGQDVTHKLGILANDNTLDDVGMGDFEVRGEVLIKKDIYASKYVDPENPKNARNFVGGILNPKNAVEQSIVEDLTIMLYDLKFDDTYSGIYGVDYLNNHFNKEECVKVYLNMDLSNYEEVYEQLFKLKNESKFLIDGFVIKFPEEIRTYIPEKDHHPEWAMAVKFPPSEVTTYIRDIEWQLGKTGKLTPVAILEPVDIDGSTVGKASMYNAGFVMKMKAFPGAKVSVSKAGEIIPKINEILEYSDTPYELPEMYKDYVLYLDDIHLMINTLDVVDEIQIRKLRHGIEILGFKGIGPAATEKLYYAGIYDISKFWTDSFTKEKLLESELFIEGRSLDIIFEVMNSIKAFKIKNVIHALQYEDAGKSVSRELGKMVSEVDYSFKSLTKKPVDAFLDPTSEFKTMYHNFYDILVRADIEIILETQKEKGVMIYEMTGKTTPFFDAKKDVITHLSKLGYEHGKLNKDCNILFTNDLESVTSKMAKAQKLGVEIRTYESIQS
jgi:DNA ligase (NAD+)